MTVHLPRPLAGRPCGRSGAQVGEGPRVPRGTPVHTRGTVLQAGARSPQVRAGLVSSSPAEPSSSLSWGERMGVQGRASQARGLQVCTPCGLPSS